VSDIADITDRSHTDLQDIGTNTHTQIDSHIADTSSNPHDVDCDDLDIVSLTEKVTPISADLLLLSDSADSNNPKKVQVGNLPSSGGGGGVSGYQVFVKYPYYPSETLGQIIAQGAMTISKLSAYIENFPGDVLSDCSDTSDWTASGDASNISLETTNFKEGGSCISFDKSATTSVNAIMSISATPDLTTKDTISAWLYIPDITNISKVRFKALVDASNYYYFDNLDTVLQSGWNIIFTGDGDTVGSPTLTGITSLEIVVEFDSTANTLTGILVDHIVHYDPGTPEVSVYKNDLLVGTFDLDYAGIVYSKTTGLTNTSVVEGDILSVKMTDNSSNYQGQNMSVTVS
jgi:hypothetical protein